MRAFLTFLLALYSVTALADTELKKILDGVDELFRSKGSEATVEMRITTPDWSRSLRMKMWTQGLDYTFVTILSPSKDKGVSTLKRKTEMWNFFPKINKVIKVPPSMMMGSWMGSDFTNDDLVKSSKLADDYTYKLGQVEDKSQVSIVLAPKPTTVSLWGRIELLVHKDTLMPIQQTFYDEKGKKVRLMEFKDIKNFGKRSMPAVMELTPFDKEGHKTVITYESAKFDVDVDKKIFTRANLQKRR